jgi:cobalt-zinc-cadmium efflux system outer membrane protein
MTTTTRNTATTVAGFLVIAAAATAAQTPAQFVDPARGRSIDEMVALALEQAPAILGARARVDVMRGDLAQAELRPSPSASVEWREQVAGSDNQLMVGIAWPLDLWGQGGRTAVAREQVTAAELGTADAERQLAASVRRTAGRLLAASRLVGLRERLVLTAKETRDLLAARAESGAGPPIDRDVAEVEWRRAEADLARERGRAEAAAADLCAMVGLSPGSPILLRDTLDAVVRGDAPGLPRVESRAGTAGLDTRPDIRAAATQVNLTVARTDLLKREARPEVSVTGSYWRMNAGFPQLGVDAVTGQPAPIHDVFHSVSIGAMVSVPWRNRQQGAIAGSIAAERAARYELDARRLSASAEIEAARALDEQARRAWDTYRGGLLELAAKNLDVVRESHRLGRATLVEVLAEMRRYLEIETAYTEAMLEVLDARVSLASAVGVIR